MTQNEKVKQHTVHPPEYVPLSPRLQSPGNPEMGGWARYYSHPEARRWGVDKIFRFLNPLRTAVLFRG